MMTRAHLIDWLYALTRMSSDEQLDDDMRAIASSQLVYRPHTEATASLRRNTSVFGSWPRLVHAVRIMRESERRDALRLEAMKAWGRHSK